jgi:long-subunit fatty acid transport protein
MKRVTLVLALAALSVPAAAGATQTSSQSSSPSKVYGTVSSITNSTVTVKATSKSRTFLRRAVSLNGIRVGSRVEAEGAVRNGVLRLSSIHLDDHAVQSGGSAKSSDDQPGDDRGGDNRGSDDRGGDDRGGNHGGDDNGGKHSGEDDGPNHH